MGFIQKLPTQLVAAFRATLEEIGEASLLLHVVDVSSPNAAAQSDTVCKILKDLGIDLPIVTVWNKVGLSLLNCNQLPPRSSNHSWQRAFSQEMPCPCVTDGGSARVRV